jgi:hypothetical protein
MPRETRSGSSGDNTIRTLASMNQEANSGHSRARDGATPTYTLLAAHVAVRPEHVGSTAICSRWPCINALLG